MVLSWLPQKRVSPSAVRGTFLLLQRFLEPGSSIFQASAVRWSPKLLSHYLACEDSSTNHPVVLALLPPQYSPHRLCLGCKESKTHTTTCKDAKIGSLSEVCCAAVQRNCTYPTESIDFAELVVSRVLSVFFWKKRATKFLLSIDYSCSPSIVSVAEG